MGKNDQRGNIAVGMANAPLPSATGSNGGVVEGQPRENRFARVFTAVVFEAEPIRKPYEFKENEGTSAERAVKQTGLASVHFEFGGIAGVNFETSRIVKRVYSDGEVSLKLTMPTYSLGKGAARKPIISLNKADEATQKEYLAFQEGVLTAFKTWRKAQLIAGHVDKVATAIGSSAQVLSAEEIAEYGL